ncbi:hypothetical protein [Mycolicibacterium hippocampi]|uniref:hypothetical protein n=1 Tax=Mycolicibacterium hippocampi TaxID=659824 RepID=UPI0035193401
MSAAEVELRRTQRELADRFNAYPPKTWTAQMMRAMINLLDAYGVLREAELDLTDTRPLRIVR